MGSEMKAPWREWLTLRFGRKDSRILSVLHLADSDSRWGSRIRLLGLALRDRDAEVREGAASALEKLTRYIHRGYVTLSGNLYTIREIYGFVETEMHKGGAIKNLRTCLADENWHVRRNAAEALGQMRARDAVERLIDAVQSDPDWHVREQAAGALGRIGDRRAVGVLIEVTMSTIHHSEHESTGYWHSDRVMRLKCVRALGDLGDPRAFPALTKALNESGEDRELRGEAREAVNRVGGEEAYKGQSTTPPEA